MTARYSLLVPFLLTAGTAVAETERQLDAHEHGVGQLNIAVEATTIAIELTAPGADIAGFEHTAETADDRAAIDRALALLAEPLRLFEIPDAAQCSVVDRSVALEGDGDAHADHDHDHDHEHKHDHEHDHAGHDEAKEAQHTEFHAEYQLDCANPSAITRIGFAYFDTFPNARELEVQVVSQGGAQAFEVERDAPVLDLGGLLGS
ncbi:DUF2796 domain-containing protein [uncultured Roseobacter sp.]|uniref:zinc uptake protein ZrgA n=1 Tax=uncultured Roseobacter sp. TaxID=114847 RepID=UPI002638978C|nr:DUF2796 domain-containing protein [uncultured Roseobacter sp.]